MKKKQFVLVIVIPILFFLTSCCNNMVMGLDIQLHPPRGTGDEQGIYNALQNESNKIINNSRYTLKYPKRGENRSAISMHRITGKNDPEAVAFYQIGSESLNKNPDLYGIILSIVRKENGKWTVLHTFKNEAAMYVDKLYFADVNGDGKDDVILGWGNTFETSELLVSCYEDKGFVEYHYPKFYNEMVVGPFMGKDLNTIFIASTAETNPEDEKAFGRLLKIVDGKIETRASVLLDKEVTRYASVITGNVQRGYYGVMLDGLKTANTYVTELIYWKDEEGKLLAPFCDPKTSKVDRSFERSITVFSRDINLDGVIEFPLVSLLPGGNPAEESNYIINWERYEKRKDSEFVNVLSTILNTKEGYVFRIPEPWKNHKFTVQSDTKTGILTFREWIVDKQNPTGAIGSAFLKIRVFTLDEWKNSTTKQEYNILKQEGELIYTAITLQPDHIFPVQIEDVKNNILLLYFDKINEQGTNKRKGFIYEKDFSGRR